MDIPTATPVEIDAELARIGEAVAVQHDIIQRVQREIAGYQDLRTPSGDTSYYDALIAKRQARIEAAWTVWDMLNAERAPYDMEFTRRGGWTRYYLVDSDSGSGHVHYDASRSRCSRVPSTRHYWLTSESGKTAVEVVELAGERACTNCFPDAPVATLSRPSVYRTPSEAERAERAEEKAAKAAKRAAKAITNPDGSPLRVNLDGYWETIETVTSAQRNLVDIVFWAKYAGRSTNDREVAACQVILAALSAKLGTDVETLKSDATVRLIKKCRRENVTY